MDHKKKFLLCNSKKDSKKIVCYTVLDPEYFILVTPNFEIKDDKMNIDIKKALKNVSAFVDN